MAFISAGVPGGSKLDVVRVVVEANHASLAGHTASEGTTIYNGDPLSTEAEGSLGLQIGQAVLHLADGQDVVDGCDERRRSNRNSRGTGSLRKASPVESPDHP
jgi:hypothetical protein